jgi:hypothetical protein
MFELLLNVLDRFLKHRFILLPSETLSPRSLNRCAHLRESDRTLRDKSHSSVGVLALK